MHDVRRLDLFLTEACNLACAYCFAAGGGRASLPLPRALEAVEWLLRSREARVHVTFWGGEPLLQREVARRVVEHAEAAAARAGKRITFALPTNATLLDEETLGWLAAHRVQTFLSIDGDAPTQALRPLAGGASSHELAARGLRRALEAAPPGAPPAVRMTVTGANAAHQADNVEYFRRLGVRELLVYPAMDQPWSEAELAAFAAGQRELAARFVAWVRAAGGPEELPRLKAWLPLLDRLASGTRRRREGPVTACAVGTGMVALAVDGRFVPCHRFLGYDRSRPGGFPLGDLAHGLDLATAAPLARLTIQDQHDEDGRRCVDCETFDLCGYGCPAIGFAAAGDIATAPRAACALMRAQADACRRAHAELEGDPRLPALLGKPLADTLRRAARGIGEAAWRRYGGDSGGDS